MCAFLPCVLLVYLVCGVKGTVVPTLSPTVEPTPIPTSAPSNFDTSNYRIRTVAGSGYVASTSGTGGKATAAGFSGLFAIHQDTTGVTYAADVVEKCIRSFNPYTDSIMYSFAGVCGTSGDTSTGRATSALFTYMSGVGSDTAGNVFVADRNVYKVKKINASGIMSLFAGTGTNTGVSSATPATSAPMGGCYDVYMNTVGTAYIPSYTLYQVYQVSASNVATVFAGVASTNAFNGDGGMATSANFGACYGVTGDSVGVIYISDYGNDRVRTVSTSNIVTTVAGSGSTTFTTNNVAATSSGFNLYNAAVDVSGNLYISDIGARALIVTTNQIIAKFAGTGTSGYTGDGGPATSAMITTPRDIFVNSVGSLYITEYSGSFRIREVYSIQPTSAPTLATSVAPSEKPTNVPSMAPSLAVTARPTTVRSSENKIFLIAGDSSVEASSTGTGGKATAATFNYPQGMWQDSLGVMYIAENHGYCIRKFGVSDAIVQNYAGQCGTQGYTGDGGAATAGLIYDPMAVVLNSVGALYYADCRANRVRIVSASNIFSTYVGTGSAAMTGDNGQATAADINGPVGVWVNSVGVLYFNDYFNYHVRTVSASGIITTFAGIGGSNGFSGNNGPATSALLSSANERVFGDSTGTVYIADSNNNQVRSVSTGGIIQAFAGSAAAAFNVDGLPATSTGMPYVTGMTIDPVNGDFYVNARSGYRVMMRTGSSGLASTVAGTGEAGVTGDEGAATAAAVNQAECLFLDTESRLYILDALGGSVRVVYSVSPTASPSIAPTTVAIAEVPTVSPSSAAPTVIPSVVPTEKPTVSIAPSVEPTAAPSLTPSVVPTESPSISIAPTVEPTAAPTPLPTLFSSPSYTVSNAYAFAGLTSDGSVLCWGAATRGGDCSAAKDSLYGVSEVVAGKNAFVAVTSFGVVAWGNAESIAGWEEYQYTPVEMVVASERAFAAVTKDGSVVAFGADCCGGNVDQYGWSQYLSDGVVSVRASSAAFAALKYDGSVYSWGSRFAGGGVSSLTRDDLSDIVQLSSTRSSFGGVTTSGGVVAWGLSATGGVIPAELSSALSGSAKYLISSERAFACINPDSGINIWGSVFLAGDSLTVSDDQNQQLRQLAHTTLAFAAINGSGSVVAWGQQDHGADISGVAASLVNVTSIVGSKAAFAAVTGAGDVITWGHSGFGASDTVYRNVSEVKATSRAFAARHLNGSVSVWGNERSGGGVSGSIASVFKQDMTRMLCANDVSFTAILTNGSAVSWGHRMSVSQSILSGDYSEVASC